METMSKKEIARILAALGNGTRLELVDHLSKAETYAGLSIAELADPTGSTRQTVAAHLDVLAEAGLLNKLKPGRAIWYELRTDELRNAIKALEIIVKQREDSELSYKAAAQSFYSRYPQRE